MNIFESSPLTAVVPALMALLGFGLPEFWALLIIVFAFAFLASEAVAHFERKVLFYAFSR